MPGESHGQRSLAGYSPWCCSESNTTEQLTPLHSIAQGTILNICSNLIIRKDPDAGRDWGQEEKGTTEDETAGWHHQLDGHELE